ncbi:MAG: hypothetical protein LBT53_02455 [Puniceicoccales bacterium]|nr:hypothetical protein [Puniceicoccales bacterium]
MVFRTNLKTEAEAHAREVGDAAVCVGRVTVREDNPSFDGRALGELANLFSDGVVVTRVRRDATTRAVWPDYTLAFDDRLLLVGDGHALGAGAACFDKTTAEDLLCDTASFFFARLVNNHPPPPPRNHAL